MQLGAEAVRFGKLERVQAAADSCTHLVNNRLIVKDVETGLRFLIDTGANVSVLPVRSVPKSDTNSNCSYTLYAANGTEIKTFGIKTLTLNFNLRRPFKWTFIIADVKQAIIGADFLIKHKLLVDLSNKKLLDQTTNLSVIAEITCWNESSLGTIDSNHPYFDLLCKYPDILKPTCFKENPPHSIFHQIETTGPPVHARARPLAPERYKKVYEEFKTMQELGICRPSKGAWASPLHVVPKKDGSLRPCGDYRALNKVTKPDRYPIPRLHDFVNMLHDKKVFSKIDLNRAYFNIRVSPEDIEKTAIITPFGLFEFPRMPFGLCNAAQTFQRFMNHSVLQGLEIINEDGSVDTVNDYLFCYLDDILLASKDMFSHKRHLDAIFKRLNEFGITINLSKCQFGQSKLEFLSFDISPEGIRPPEKKVQEIVNFNKPRTVEQLRRFLGMLNFYRPHIPKAAHIQAKLNDLIHSPKKKDKTPIIWTPETDTAFLQCKTSLLEAATLSHPLPNSPLALMTDASDDGVGAVLQTKVDGKYKPLGYFSRKLSAGQRKYSTYDRELLAMYLAVQHFSPRIEGHSVTIFTDHKPLVYCFTKKASEKDLPRRIRQLMYISEYTTDIQYVSGSDNIVADTLSRLDTITCPTAMNYSELALAQDADKELKELLLSNNNNSVRITKLFLPGSDTQIYCEVSTENARPYIPREFRRNAFNLVHNLSHPGIRATRRLMATRYFWPKMNVDVGTWTKTCMQCQMVKVNRHTISRLGTFEKCGRMDHLHLDIIGPLLTTADGYRYCVTMVDRATGWPEAFPVKDIFAETIAKTVYEGWITRFGCPIKITTDQGRQFESNLFAQLMKFLGVNKLRTTPYHPQSNGTVERWHRSLKSALMARLIECNSWIQELPTVLYGLRAVPRDETSVSAAEFLYGLTIRLPGDFYDKPKVTDCNAQEYVQKIRNVIEKYRPKSTTHRDSRTLFVHRDLATCSHVFIRNDAVRKPLQPPYQGPFKVLKRDKKYFSVQLADRIVNISIDRLKPAYILNDECVPTSNSLPKNCDNNTNKSNVNNNHVSDKQPITCTTRSGRNVKRPVRFLL